MTIEIQLSANTNAPPTEFRIWAYGPVKTSKYPDSVLDPEGAAECVRRAAEHGIELSVDYEHAAVGPADGQPKPAAAWFTLEARSDGLWAVNVRWTERARTMLVAREYRHFSPVYRLDADGRIVEVVNLALTNLPATRHQAPLMAAKAEAIVAASAADRSLLVETLSTLFSASGTSTLKEAMGWIDAAALIVEASRDANIARAVDEGIAARKLLKSQRETFVELGRSIGEAKLRATIATLETRESASVARLLDDASVRGLIPPAQRATWEAAAAALGADWLKSAVDGMSPMVASIRPASTSPDIAPADTSPDGAALAIDDELRIELARMGLSEKDYKAMKRATRGAQ